MQTPECSVAYMAGLARKTLDEIDALDARRRETASVDRRALLKQEIALYDRLEAIERAVVAFTATTGTGALHQASVAAANVQRARMLTRHAKIDTETIADLLEQTEGLLGSVVKFMAGTPGVDAHAACADYFGGYYGNR